MLLEKYEKWHNFLGAHAMVITLKTQKRRKKAPRLDKFNFLTNCDRQKQFSQT